jgi:hypothetical protein
MGLLSIAAGSPDVSTARKLLAHIMYAPGVCRKMSGRSSNIVFSSHENAITELDTPNVLGQAIVLPMPVS